MVGRGTLHGEDRLVILVAIPTISAARRLRDSGFPPPVLDGPGIGGDPESPAYVGQWTLALELGHRVNFAAVSVDLSVLSGRELGRASWLSGDC